MVYIYIYIHPTPYVIMKTMCSPVITTMALWQIMHLGTWAHDVRLHIADTNEPKNVQQAKQGV